MNGMEQFAQTAERKRRLSMFLEENRLASFKKWVFSEDHACSASKMAEAGFFSVATKEDPDTVQCFLCSKTLDGWDREDDPWKEHLAHAKNCMFAKLGMPEEEYTPSQLADLKREQLHNVMNEHFVSIIESRKDIFEHICAELEKRQ